MDVTEDLSPFCASFTEALEIIGRRWTGAIVRALMAGHTRFSEIAATVPGLSDRLLSERLKELEDEGIVRRKVTDCRPVRVDYELTDLGGALLPVVQSVEAWAGAWAARTR